MTVFRDEFGAEFVLFFGVLLGAKVLHWIAGDRVDFVGYYHASFMSDQNSD
jgi:hypothetical protein